MLTDVKPVEHDALHVLDDVISTRPPEHAVQLDADTLQLAQLLEQEVYLLLPDWYEPAGHVVTHVEPYRYGVDDVDEHVRQFVDVTLHVAHVEEHDWHALPSE